MGDEVATAGSPGAIPPDCPEELLQALKARGATIERFRRIPRRVRVWASSPSEKLFGWYSTDPADQAIVEYEVAVRAAIGTALSGGSSGHSRVGASSLARGSTA